MMKLGFRVAGCEGEMFFFICVFLFFGFQLWLLFVSLFVG